MTIPKTPNSSKQYLKDIILDLGAPTMVSKQKLSSRIRNAYNRDGIESFIEFSGIAGKPSLNPIPKRWKGATERVFPANPKTNATITIGYDRISDPASGYGGRGEPHAAAIDIVAGNMAQYGITKSPLGPVLTPPSFRVDASRMYLSQKTDVDDYFDLPLGSIGNKTGLSAAAIKADAVRVIARDGGIKLVAGVDNRNAQTQKILDTPGIDLIGGGDDQGLQPMVLGNNLKEAMEGVMLHISDLRETTQAFIKYQKNFNDVIQNHNHNTQFFGLPSAPSFNLMFEGFKSAFQMTVETEGSIIASIVNQEIDDLGYFNPISEKYILSAFNNTN